MREKAGTDFSQIQFWNTCLTVHPFSQPHLEVQGSLCLPEQHGCANTPCVQLPAGGEVPWLSCSPGPARYAPTFFISPDVWSPFCFEIVLHQARAFQPWISATARNEIQMSVTYGKSTISLEYCRQWNPTLMLKLLSCSFISLPQNAPSLCLCQSTLISWTDGYRAM